MNKELNRLASYTRWPLDSNARPSKLARCGFYATGNDDSTICFSCSASLSQWEFGDDPIQKHRHEAPNCSVVTGQNSTNVPLVPLCDDFDGNSNRDVIDANTEAVMNESAEFFRICRSALNRAKQRGVLESEQPALAVDPENPDFELLRREAARLATFTNFPTNSAVTPTDLAKAGFFYKGPRDRVQCVFCRGLLRNWVPGDDPMSEHRKHMSHCPLVNDSAQHGNVRIEDDNVLHAPAAVMHTDSSAASQVSQGVSEVDGRTLHNQPTFANLTFESHVPSKHPQYASVRSRRQTFLVDGVCVPRGQNVDVLADAGFFHVGPDDNVKCFCCDVGLKNWRQDDSPWVEHARWSPRCAYIRQQKDAPFIAEAERASPAWTQDVRSSRVTNPSLTPTDDESSSYNGASSAAAAASRDHNSSVDSAAVAMTTDVNSRPRSRRNKKKDAKKAAANDVQEDSEPGDSDANVNNVDDNDAETQMLLEENRQLRDARTCRVCMDQEVNVVFLPCGHLVCCDSCAPALRSCAVCRSLIRGTVKVFLT